MDKKMIKKLKKGHLKTFEWMVRQYEKKLFGYIYKLVGDRGLAEDILQETFIKAYRKLNTIDEAYAISSWLMTIARNTAIDHMRKQKITLVSISEEFVDSQLPEEVLLTEEKYQALEACVQRLPEHYKVLIVMKYFDELTYVEISEALAMDMNKVKWQLRQARVMLKKMIVDKEGSECLVK